MRFKTPLMEAIREGRKTVTRRLVRFDRDKAVLPCLYKVGRTYIATDRPRFEKTTEFLRIPIRIVGINRESLAYIGEKEAEREGFRAIMTADGRLDMSAEEQFYIAWGSIHGWPHKPIEVWRIEFTLAPKGWKRG